ncbi:hypothetical protein ACJX0J_040579 [Zea mays]
MEPYRSSLPAPPAAIITVVAVVCAVFWKGLDTDSEGTYCFGWEVNWFSLMGSGKGRGLNVLGGREKIHNFFRIIVNLFQSNIEESPILHCDKNSMNLMLFIK